MVIVVAQTRARRPLAVEVPVRAQVSGQLAKEFPVKSRPESESLPHDTVPAADPTDSADSPGNTGLLMAGFRLVFR